LKFFSISWSYWISDSELARSLRLGRNAFNKVDYTMMIAFCAWWYARSCLPS